MFDRRKDVSSIQRQIDRQIDRWIDRYTYIYKLKHNGQHKIYEDLFHNGE